jgi:uncharacterized protein
MPANTLFHYIDAPKWADRETVIDQVYPLAMFARLCEGAVDGGEKGEVAVRLRLHRDAQGFIVLEGRLATQVALVCQRCLEPVIVDVDADLRLWLLRDESEADRLPDDADYLTLDEEGRLALGDALEDELILALPLVPRHDDCEAFLVTGEASGVVEAAPRENPFQALAALKAPKA